jgi:SlyX protein
MYRGVAIVKMEQIEGVNMEDRLVELEIRYMHQQRLVAELSDVVYQQQQSLQRIERDIAQIRDQLNLALPSLVRSSEEEEPPPHY